MGDDNDLIEVMGSQDLRDRETGSLSIKRGASYPIADREYLAGSFTIGKRTQREMIVPPRSLYRGRDLLWRVLR